ncbi:hypothetical protein RSOL_395670 [Rhizoctonia solani AG-3 Rhs1AP]|uniref:Uncharacterized protein n=2 Tax=Rhizoctonia solani AG-3 TaxID=1086053 RepID=A0A074SIA6_9AGAM|nr:hypothetical protein RSOL_395670 [Rhizoctonia solani AG-3 Rhs1AP]KEP49717.1 hypothetical protein V565_094510 [Rhizoctonia solani 123E]
MESWQRYRPMHPRRRVSEPCKMAFAHVRTAWVWSALFCSKREILLTTIWIRFRKLAYRIWDQSKSSSHGLSQTSIPFPINLALALKPQYRTTHQSTRVVSNGVLVRWHMQLGLVRSGDSPLVGSAKSIPSLRAGHTLALKRLPSDH